MGTYLLVYGGAWLSYPQPLADTLYDGTDDFTYFCCAQGLFKKQTEPHRHYAKS